MFIKAALKPYYSGFVIVWPFVSTIKGVIKHLGENPHSKIDTN